MPLSGPSLSARKPVRAGGKPPFAETDSPYLGATGSRESKVLVHVIRARRHLPVDISQYMIAPGHFVSFDPRDQIDERRRPIGTSSGAATSLG